MTPMLGTLGVELAEPLLGVGGRGLAEAVVVEQTVTVWNQLLGNRRSCGSLPLPRAPRTLRAQLRSKGLDPELLFTGKCPPAASKAQGRRVGGWSLAGWEGLGPPQRWWPGYTEPGTRDWGLGRPPAGRSPCP